MGKRQAQGESSRPCRQDVGLGQTLIDMDARARAPVDRMRGLGQMRIDMGAKARAPVDKGVRFGRRSQREAKVRHRESQISGAEVNGIRSRRRPELGTGANPRLGAQRRASGTGTEARVRRRDMGESQA